MLDFFFKTPLPNTKPRPTVPEEGDTETGKKKKPTPKKKKAAKDPLPAETGVELHASFTPLPAEKNVPTGVEEDVFEDPLFGAACDEGPWEYETECEVEEDDGDSTGDSIAESGYGASMDDSDDARSVFSRSPARVGSEDFRWPRRRPLREAPIVYTGPQLLIDSEDDDEGIGAF